MIKVFKLGLFCAIAIGAVAQESTPPAPPDSNAPATEQGGPGRGMMRGGMHGSRIMGEITAISSDGFTLKEMNGDTKRVKVSPETRVMQNHHPIKLSDLKVGASVMAAGQTDSNDSSVLDARFVIDNTQQMKEFKENLGKTVIAGEVKAVDGTKLTILRPDGQTQVIEADENTSFQRGRNSITLADIKPGDHIMGRGQLKDGTFVPNTLRVGGIGSGMFMMGRGGERQGPSPQTQTPDQNIQQQPR